MTGTGRRPVPFQQFVLKMHGRCNLACTYCYLYTMADEGWRTAPRAMSAEVAARAAGRIAEHAHRHGLAHIEVIFHGGEPLLAGADALAHTAATVRAALPRGCRVTFGMQTNGVLLDRRALDVLATEDIQVAVSLDGDPTGHDRRRPTRDGRGSHAAVRAAIRRLATPRYRHLYAGLLCVVDIEADPVRTYDALLDAEPPRLDFLLPHGNWTAPPPGRSGTRYGEWLSAAFDRWYDAPARETRVRLFEEIVNLLLGGPSRSEQVGLSPVAMLVIGTDGSLEQVDTLRSAYDGAAATGLTVFDSDLDVALRHPAVVARQVGRAALAETCRRCSVVEVCGGGNYAHRYRAGAGFVNPSVYCADLKHLILHISRRLRRDVARLAGRRRG